MIGKQCSVPSEVSSKTIKNINHMCPMPTSHGIGCKRVLLANNETNTKLTQIAITDLMEKEESETHVHPTMEEFFLVIAGEVIIRVDTEHYQLRAGDFMQVSAGEPHSIKAVINSKVLTIGCATEN